MAKSSKRVKPEKLLQSIPDWKHAGELVHRIGQLQVRLQKIQTAAAEKVDEIKAHAAAQAIVVNEKIELYVLSLEQFAKNNRNDFGTAKSKKLTFGTLGWRSSTSIKVGKNTLQRIKEFFTPGKRAGLIHTKEAVDKNALAKLTDEELAGVGARRKTTEGFYVEPDIDVIHDGTDA